MATQEGIMELIYNKINSVLGAGNQLFTMQFPAQPLNYRLYQYDTSNNNSALTKPFSITENEFRLSDQLFDVSPITAGSNGERLSVVYNTLINNFIPKLDYLVPFIRDRAGLGNFLEEDSGEKDANGESLSRIELCKKLYQEYLEAKNAWNESKTRKYDTFKDEYTKAQSAYESARDQNVTGAELNKLERAANDKAGWSDAYANWLSTEGMVEQEKLNNLYNDVVVRGHLHEVMTILGYLNASSIAEELEVTKQKMRNSSRSSLDESMTIYPVQFQPNNWFKALTPNVNPADLTMAKDSIRDQLMAKQKELSRANSELAQMDLMNVKPEQIAQAQQKVELAQGNLKDKEKALYAQHGKVIVDLAKNLVKANPIDTAKKAVDKAAIGVFGVSLSDEQMKILEGAVNGIIDSKKLQEEANESLAELQTLKAQRAQLDSRDWKFNKSSLQQRVQELTVEVEYYIDLLANVSRSHEENKAGIEEKRTELTQALKESTDRVIADLTKRNGEANEPLNGKISGIPTASENVFSYAPQVQAILDTQIKYLGDQIKKIDPQDATKAQDLTKLTTTQQALLDEQSALNADQANLAALEPPVLSARQTEADAEVSGMFQDILIKSSRSTESSSQSESSSSSSSKWAVSGWFFSAGGQSSTSSSQSAQESAFFNQDIEIGFRVAKVSFDRGGWFNPSIFKMSNAFYHLAPVKVSGGLSIDDVKTGKHKEKLSWSDNDLRNQPYVLPAFPVAMAIAKDITIKVKTASGQSKSSKSVVENATASGGSFLCFSASSGSASKNSSEATFHGATADAYYIRIPGPQVIGYFLQFVPKDNSFPYSATTTQTKDGKESEVIAAFNLYKNPNRLNKSDNKPTISPASPVPVPVSKPVE